MTLSLDGNISYIGTEFIKLLNTGSSDLATVQYVDDAIAEGGGGGAIDAYTKTETDNLLNNKLNVNNPQDIIGTLRIDSTNGNGKLIVNAVGAPNDEDFYVNGLSNLGGTLKCTLLQASSNIETSQLIRSDTLNSYSNTDMKIQRNSIDYIVLESDKVNFKRDIYVNDVLLTGGGSGNPFDENVVINNPYELQCNTFNNSVLNQDMVFNINGGEWFRLQFSDNTVRVPNTKSLLSQEIYFNNIRPLAFSDDVVFYGGNATNDAYEEYVRLDASTERVNFSKTIDTSENILMNLNKRLYLNYTVGSERYIGSTFRSGTPSFNQLDIVNENSSNGRIRLTINTEENVIIENSQLYSKRVITAVAGVKGNTYNSNGDNDVVFQRDDVEFFKLDKFTEDTVEKEAIICSKQLRANGNILVKNLQINQFPVGVEYADFRLENADSVMRFYVGNATSVNFQITNNELILGRVANCTAGLKSNIIDTYTDTDLIFRRNGVEYFRLDDLTGTDILNVANDKGISASYVFGNRFWNRSFSSDTTFFGSNVAGDDRVEYMKWNYLSQSVDYNAPIDNTGLAITGNIIDTTVSDKKLKKNINDIITNASKVIKNVNTKTFEYKDEKHGKGVQFGFVANDLLEELPDVFSKIIGQDKDGNYNINHIKLSVILWKALQEQILKNEEKDYKIEHLEARLFEVEDIIKELTGKKTTKPKAKAKSKAKAEK